MGKPNPLLAGAAGRCPNCGEGWLFEGFLKVSPRCEACGFDLAKADSVGLTDVCLRCSPSSP